MPWCIGVRAQRLGQLDIERPSRRRTPPISDAHALADRARYGYRQSHSWPRGAAGVVGKHATASEGQYRQRTKEVGTIDDNTGNYRRAPGTIDDGKKMHKTQEKPTPK
jgi:hypothetical protein